MSTDYALSARQAESRALELLNTARTLAELAGELIDQHRVDTLDFDISRSNGVTTISWYNSSESC